MVDWCYDPTGRFTLFDYNNNNNSLIELYQTHNTQMSIMLNVLNKRTMINTTRNTMAADL